MIRLEDTSGSDIAGAITAERHRMGSPTTGMVLTLLILADESCQSDATLAAIAAARLHPMRVLTLIPRPQDQQTRLDAEVSVGGDGGPGETAVIRLRGRLAEHANSVAVPLLLPDTPVVAFWPSDAPEVPGDDPIGRHAQRRITDAAAARDPAAALRRRAAGYQPGDTDLTWARLTPWRSLLATVFDAPVGRVTGGHVHAEAGDPSALLLAAWLRRRLKATLEIVPQDEPRNGSQVRRGATGVTGVTLQTRAGEIRVDRIDERTATLLRPGAPETSIALPSGALAELLAEELRRLDPDEAYGSALRGAVA
ncbi:MAG: glucose-6-phosphate dehydrogenase assembly protein OpcA [Actinomycetales bacterium]|nr:glucose-6-phosphate dehydrogenase assembly protein OpcA [Actinomycetales bacterium]